MPRRRSYASKVPSQPKKQTKPVNQTKVPAVPSKQPTSVEQRSPGLFGQIASTAAGVAIGNTISRGLFSGGSSSEIPDSQEPQTQYSPQTKDEQPRYSDFQSNDYGGASCEADAKALTKCLESNNHDISLCQFYLENLKACQQMASRF